MVEGARLESVYRSKAYRGFESLSLRQSIQKLAERLAFFVFERKRVNWNKKAYIYIMQILLIILFVLAIFPLALLAKKQPNNTYIKIGYVAIVLISMGYLSFDYLQNPKESSAFTLILLLVLVSTNKLFRPNASR